MSQYAWVLPLAVPENWSDLSQPHPLVLLMNCKAEKERATCFLYPWLRSPKICFLYFWVPFMVLLQNIKWQEEGVFFPCFLLNSFNLFFSFSLTVLEFKKLFWHLMLPVLTPAIGAVYNCALNINLIFTSLA